MPGLHPSGEKCPLLHGELLGLDVAFELGLLHQLAAVRGNRSLDFSIHLHLPSFHVALDRSILSDRDRSALRLDFTIHFSVDDHVICELDRSHDLDPLSQHVRIVRHFRDHYARPGLFWQSGVIHISKTTLPGSALLRGVGGFTPSFLPTAHPAQESRLFCIWPNFIRQTW